MGRMDAGMGSVCAHACIYSALTPPSVVVQAMPQSARPVAYCGLEASSMMQILHTTRYNAYWPVQCVVPSMACSSVCITW